MIVRRLAFAFAGLSALLLAFFSGYLLYPLLHTGNGDPFAGTPSLPDADRVDMATYWQVWNLLEQDFYGERPSEQQRTYGAVAGMVGTFADPYTYFVEPQPRELERDNLRGSFGGIGATIEQSSTVTGTAIFLLHPLPDQPAMRAGVVDGDRLLAVDDVELTGTLRVDDVVGLVRGPVDTEVRLRIERGAGVAARQQEIAIIRAEIRTPSLEWGLLDSTPGQRKIGYLRQSLFSERSIDEMTGAIDDLTAQGATAFIWDLRGNPGGLVSAAVGLLDLWLEDGLVLIEEKAGGTRTNFEATAGVASAAPLVVLVDGGSASASEIVAGALRDRNRATLVGQKTFGKGSVQLIHELPDQSSLHVTNAQWFTPGGLQISGQGLTPDRLVADGEDPLPVAVDLLNAAPKP